MDIFNEKIADRYPPSRPWDDKIETKPGFKPKSIKAYNLNQEELKLQEEFIKDNLEKGYIRPSQSPMASPFFFVSKKDSKQLRPTQDYWYRVKFQPYCNLYMFFPRNSTNLIPVYVILEDKISVLQFTPGEYVQ